MSKCKKTLSTFLSAAIISAGMVMPANAAAGDEVTALSKDGVAFRFALIGDSHVNASKQNLEHFEDAVETLNTVGGIDAYGLNGDIILYTTAVTETPYDIINEVLTTNKIGNSEGYIPYIYAMGNHEFIQNDNATDTCAEAVAMFTKKTGQSLNSHKEYNGYHVIASGGESYNCQWSAGNYNTDEEWIMDEITAIEASADYNPNEPIFLMLHHPIIDSTLRGLESIARRYTTDFVDFLAERPNIVQLTAHQHYAAQNPQTICQDLGFTAYQTPLTSTVNSSVHQVSFIDVTTDNKVKIYKIDLTTNTYIGEPWVIDIAAGVDGFKYTDTVRAGNTQAPVFADDAAITVSDIENYSATITYPTGMVEAKNDQQDNLVRSHRVTVTDKESGDVISTTSYSASFNVVPQPTEQSKILTNLKSGTTYTVSVEPMSMFGVYGEAITTEFTTAGVKVDVVVDDAIALTYDKNLVGEITDADAGTASYTSVSSAVGLKQGKYFTYTVNVGEGQEIEDAGMYRIGFIHGAKNSASVLTSVKHLGKDNYVPMAKTDLPASGSTNSAYSDRITTTSDDYITLEEGENIIKIYAYSVSNSDTVYIEAPVLSKVTSGAVVDYVLNKDAYITSDPDAEDSTEDTTTYYKLSNSSYIKVNYLGFKTKDYFIVPVKVPYTAAYNMSISATAYPGRTYSFKAAYATSAPEAAALTSYPIAGATQTATSSQGRTSGYAWHTLTDSVVLEGGVQYYFKIYTTVNNNDTFTADQIRFTDNGEYSINADLSSLAVSGADFTFDADTTDYTVYAPMPDGKIVTVAATSAVEGATVTGTGDVSVNYGINEIPVTVTSRNGKVTKTYTVKYIVTESLYISSGITATGNNVYVSDSTTQTSTTTLDDSNCTDLFSKKLSRWKVLIKYAETGYIQADLGDLYKLNEIVINTYAYYDTVIGMTITAANNPDFSDEVIIGTNSEKKEGPTISIKLDSTNAYKYIRINKTGTNYNFLPTQVKLYAESEITSTASELTETVTVPSKYYVVGDKIVAAAYNAEGRITAVNFTDAANAASTDVALTKKNTEDTVKVMVWKDFENLEPRIEAVSFE